MEQTYLDLAVGQHVAFKIEKKVRCYSAGSILAGEIVRIRGDRVTLMQAGGFLYTVRSGCVHRNAVNA